MPRPKKLTSQQIAQAATNSPALADAYFDLGPKAYPILDLKYDDYIIFTSLLEPVLLGLVGKFSSSLGMASAASDFSSELVKSLAKDLPQMVRLMCAQSDPSVTVEDVKAWAKSPFQLATLVVRQVERNNIVKDLTDFFFQILPLLKLGQTKAATATTQTQETPSQS